MERESKPLSLFDIVLATTISSIMIGFFIQHAL